MAAVLKSSDPLKDQLHGTRVVIGKESRTLTVGVVLGSVWDLLH